MNKQIEEIAKHCCFPCEMECNGECIERKNPCECYIALTTAEELYNAGYRRQDEVAREIFAEIEEIFFKYADKFSSVGECKLVEPVRQAVLFASNELFVYVEELKKKYGVIEE